jgi:integrase
VGDYDPETGKLTVRAGKGRKGRTVYVTGNAAKALERWLLAYNPESHVAELGGADSAAEASPRPRRGTARAKGRGATPAMPLFVPMLKGGDKLRVRRLNAQTIYDMLKRRAGEAGLNDFSPHDFRRTFVGDLLDRGVDIATVANMAGHASVDTTRRYDRRPEDTKRAAAEKLDFPDLG